MIRSDLRNYLTTVCSRVYPVVLPQGVALPAITYSRVTGGHDHNLKSATGSAIPTFELNCLALSYQQADELAEAVRQKMQGFSGTLGTSEVRSTILDDEADSFESLQDDSDDGVFIITLRYRIRYDESVPT